MCLRDDLFDGHGFAFWALVVHVLRDHRLPHKTFHRLSATLPGSTEIPCSLDSGEVYTTSPLPILPEKAISESTRMRFLAHSISLRDLTDKCGGLGVICVVLKSTNVDNSTTSPLRRMVS